MWLLRLSTGVQPLANGGRPKQHDYSFRGAIAALDLCTRKLLAKAPVVTIPHVIEGRPAFAGLEADLTLRHSAAVTLEQILRRAERPSVYFDSHVLPHKFDAGTIRPGRNPEKTFFESESLFFPW